MSPAQQAALARFACYCLRVSHEQVLAAIETKQINSIQDIIRYTQAGDGCTACHPLLKRYLRKKGYCSDPICSAK
ncbi:MAG: (2Fe-2S)-binding protein [Elusimicrobia bacterium]|nr:(2Fe-2S)-binding protein [Elusimicrobiota bacterium]